jgi:hypothetical protein
MIRVKPLSGTKLELARKLSRFAERRSVIGGFAGFYMVENERLGCGGGVATGFGYGFFVSWIKKLRAFSKPSASYILQAFSKRSS